MTLTVSDTTLGDLRWQDLRDAIAARSASPRGAERARGMPFLTRVEATRSLARIEEARHLLRRDLPMPLGGVEDVREVLVRASKGAVLEAPELLRCASLGAAAAAVGRFVGGLAADVPLLAEVARDFADLSPLAARIHATFEPSGTMRDDASVELAEQRRRARSLHRAIKAELDGMLKDEAFALQLQDNYYSVRNDRYVIPLKAHFRAQVPGIVHNASQSGQTIFVEVQTLVPLGNELAIAEAIAAEEERRVLTELSQQVADRAGDVEGNAERLALLDALQSCARLAEDMECSEPEFADPQGPIVLRGARHPLLLLQANKKVIPNTIVLDGEGRALVISGPNAGGKTVAMATVGICTLMARAGLPVPADQGSRIPFVEGVSCTIGDSQDLARDLSTFTAHLQQLAAILTAARPGWLCLIDEIASGTDPAEGAALATACLESLVDADARVVVTTHLEEVKAYAVNDPRFVNARVGLDATTLQPTFELELGTPGVSSAIEVAAQAGLPARVIARARENLRETGALTLALESLARQEDRAAALGREVERTQLALIEQQRALAERDEELARARAEVEARVRAEMADELQEVRRQAAETIAALQAGPSMREAQRLQRDTDEAIEQMEHRRVAAHLRTDNEARPGGEDFAPVVGDRVRVVSLDRDGEVIAVDGDMLTVAVGNLRTRARRRDVVALIDGKPQPARPPGKRVRDPAEVAAQTVVERPARLDVRGLRVDDALRELEEFLDQSYYKGPNRLLIIHGHGTGALRQAVRDFLGISPYVAALRAGDRHEGGDGATYVELAT